MRIPAAIVPVLLVTGSSLAGPLSPPAGPVTPTYKTLQEVEPRIAIGQGTTPGDATTLFRITVPGSYYLTSSVTAAPDQIGISIDTSDVTVDLNGFTLGSAGGVGSGNHGIGVAGIVDRVEVRNGTISGFRGDGVSAFNTDRTVVTRVLVESCTRTGIEAGDSSLVTDCVVRACGFNGILIRRGIVDRCIIEDVPNHGVSATRESRISNCVIEDAGPAGITTSKGSIIVGNSVTQTPTAIVAGDDCLVTGNVVAEGVSTGIRVNGAGNRVDQNHVSANSRGVWLLGDNNVMVRNTSAASATFPYDVAGANNLFGPIVVFGGTGDLSTLAGGGNPWANMQH